MVNKENLGCDSYSHGVAGASYSTGFWMDVYGKKYGDNDEDQYSICTEAWSREYQTYTGTGTQQY